MSVMCDRHYRIVGLCVRLGVIVGSGRLSATPRALKRAALSSRRAAPQLSPMKAKSRVDLLALAPPFLEKKSNALRFARVVHDGTVLAAYQDTGSYRLYNISSSSVPPHSPLYDHLN